LSFTPKRSSSVNGKNSLYLLFQKAINGLTILFKVTVILLLRKIYPTRINTLKDEIPIKTEQNLK
jgi:hypothetical protein